MHAKPGGPGPTARPRTKVARSIRGVLLDVDGTLIDSNEAHAQAWVLALAEHGYRVPLAKVRPLIGMGGDKLLPRVCGIDEQTREGRLITKRRRALFEQRFLPTLRPFRGVRELLARMRGRGLRLAVASSAKRGELEALLRRCGADDLIDHGTSSDDADRSKPDPDIIHAALVKGGLRPGEAVLLGDTPYDIESAGRAGVRVIAFRCGGWADADLAGALAIYDGPADLLARFDASPLGGRLPARTVSHLHRPG